MASDLGSDGSYVSRAKAYTGNLIVVELRNTRYALIRSLHIQEDFAPEPLQGAGEVQVVEWVPTTARYTLTADWMVSPGGITRGHIIPEDYATRLGTELFNITIYDRFNMKLGEKYVMVENELRQYQDCSYVSGTISIEAHRIVTTNAVFHAISASGTSI